MNDLARVMRRWTGKNVQFAAASYPHHHYHSICKSDFATSICRVPNRTMKVTGSSIHRYCRKSAVHRSAVRSNASSKFLQNYAGGRVRQPRTPNTSAERKFPKPNYTKAIPCQKDCFTLDSHMLTSSSFFSLQTQHDQSRGNTNTTKTNKTGKNRRQRTRRCVPCVGLSYVKLCDTAALVH